MRPRQSDCFVQPRAGTGSKAFDTKQPSRITRRIWLNQQIWIVGDGGSVFRKRGISVIDLRSSLSHFLLKTASPYPGGRLATFLNFKKTNVGTRVTF